MRMVLRSCKWRPLLLISEGMPTRSPPTQTSPEPSPPPALTSLRSELSHRVFLAILRRQHPSLHRKPPPPSTARVLAAKYLGGTTPPAASVGSRLPPVGAEASPRFPAPIPSFLREVPHPISPSPLAPPPQTPGPIPRPSPTPLLTAPSPALSPATQASRTPQPPPPSLAYRSPDKFFPSSPAPTPGSPPPRLTSEGMRQT